MCFSVNVNLVKEEIEERYGIEFPGKYRYEPSYYYHAFSFPVLPAICSGRVPAPAMLRWGLIPSWIKTEEEARSIRTKTFNARSETVNKKASFSASFGSRRCIIPVKGFFEWQHAGGRKLPWYIFLPGDQIMSLAGLYSAWTNEATGETESTFTIITTEANELMAEIHNSGKRMPAILDRDEEKHWLDLSLPSSGALSLLKPYPEGKLTAHTVSPLINDKSSNRNTPDLIKPYDYIQTGKLF